MKVQCERALAYKEKDNMTQEELKSKLETIKEELVDILLDESIVDVTTFKFDVEIRKSAKSIVKALKEI